MSQHNLSGVAHPAMNAAQQTTGIMSGHLTQPSLHHSVLVGNGSSAAMFGAKSTHSKNRTIFSARIEVVQVNNGYMVQIGRQEGYEYDSYIATTIKEVNDILTAQMVAMKLEG